MHDTATASRPGAARDPAPASVLALRWTLAVLVAGLVAAGATGWAQHRANQARLQAELDAAAAQVAAQLRQRMRSYEYALFATRGAVRVAGGSAEQLTREAFRRFAGSFDLRERFPGARGVGFVRRMPRDQDEAFMEEMRRKGEPGFRIRELNPEGLDARERYLLMFLEPPTAGAAAVEGLDLATELRRRESLRASMLSGEPRISAPLALAQDGTAQPRSFVLSLPVYARGGSLRPEERAQATYGWAVMPLVADEVMADFDSRDGALALALGDLRPWGEAERFFASAGWREAGSRGVKALRLEVFGREWEVRVQALAPFAQRLRLPSPLAAALSVASGFAVLALLLHALLRAAQRQRHEQTLRRRTEQAEAANHAKSAFLAHMSHEIRTPLNAVIGLSQLLQRMALPDKQRLYVDHIASAGTQLLALVNDVLDVSKIEAGEMRLEDVAFEPRPLLHDLRAQAEVLAAGKPLRLQLDVADDFPERLRGDPMRLKQVLLNLLNNAVKFTPEGLVTLRAQALHHEDGRKGLRFDVSDTGIGIAPEQQQAIFEPFTQADASTTRRFGGTGLGLAIVKRLVAMMGGELALQSQPGAGSTFSVTLPLRAAE
ncbi:CHASE domain-containing protein [Azohydromonas aeria]|uniref:CHASE domain-containing protein n=1 Tax=Azohydromonas aeria TaxID=2590212 RepID=UPI0012FAF455|nr:CHASE domain-containing protein [Azohydromonas aeria]